MRINSENYSTHSISDSKCTGHVNEHGNVQNKVEMKELNECVASEWTTEQQMTGYRKRIPKTEQATVWILFDIFNTPPQIVSMKRVTRV